MSHPLRRSERVVFPGGLGLQLAGIVDLPVDAPRAMAVYAHCFTCSKDIKAAVRISRSLASAGFGVLRFDFMGLGESQGDFSDSNFSTNCADLRAAITFVAQNYAAPSLLLGHSFGGAACMAVAGQVESVLGISTIASPSDTHHLAALLERMNPAIASQGVGDVTIGGRTYTITRQMVDDFRNYDMQTTLSQLAKPVLIFHSPNDETLKFAHALRLLDALAPRALSSLISLPGADHLLTKRPHDVEYVAGMIGSWWNRLL